MCQPADGAIVAVGLSRCCRSVGHTMSIVLFGAVRAGVGAGDGVDDGGLMC